MEDSQNAIEGESLAKRGRFQESFDFFCLSAAPTIGRFGWITLFGKKQVDDAFIDVAIHVNDLQYKVHVAPREVASRDFHDVEKGDEVEIDNVMEELKTLMEKKGAGAYKMKQVRRSYHFDTPGVQKGVSDWVKLTYDIRGGRFQGNFEFT